MIQTLAEAQGLKQSDLNQLAVKLEATAKHNLQQAKPIKTVAQMTEAELYQIVKQACQIAISEYECRQANKQNIGGPR